MQSDFHNQNKSLLTRLGEVIDQHRATNQTASYSEPSGSRSGREHLRRFLPTPGNAIFTLLLIGGLLLAQNSGALSLFAAPNSQSASTGTIAYQGRLADTSGAPLTDTYNMGFRLYSAATGGAPLWTEEWTGSNGVRVSDGLFNVMLGSLTSIPQAVITGNENLFLGITVGTDDEMAPRVQLGSVPFATQALTVPDGSITAAKIAQNAVTGFWYASGTSDASTSSVEPAVLPEMDLTINVTDGPVEIAFSSGFSIANDPTAGYVAFGLYIDEQLVARHAQKTFQLNESTNVQLHWAGELAPGEHTVQMKWWVRNESVRASALASNLWEQRVLTVREYRR